MFQHLFDEVHTPYIRLEKLRKLNEKKQHKREEINGNTESQPQQNNLRITYILYLYCYLSLYITHYIATIPKRKVRKDG